VDPDSRSPSSRPQRTGAPRLRVSVTDGRGRTVPDGGLGRWLARVAPSAARGELAIALVTDARMRVLNRSYRRKDYATDVLSFDGAGRDGFPAKSDGLGDLVIARGVAARQAREAGHSFQTELRVLALHGLLHLLGYDHENATDRGAMARVEVRLRKKGGLKAGLIARSRPVA
jgi:probable rRNA maturation factor